MKINFSQSANNFKSNIQDPLPNKGGKTPQNNKKCEIKTGKNEKNCQIFLKID